MTNKSILYDEYLYIFYPPKLHQNARFRVPNFKIFPGVIPPDPLGGRGRPPPCTLPQLGLRPRAGALRAPGSAVTDRPK